MSTGRGSGGGNGVQHIPEAARKIVQSLKEVVNCSEVEIYATLKDMDPDEAVSRLLSQDPFHEVKSKREKKKEAKDTYEYRPRGSNNSSTRHGGSMPYHSSESAPLQWKAVYKKESEATPFKSSLPSAPSISGNNKSRETTGLSDDTSAENKEPSGVQPPSISHSARADIVKMSRPHSKLVNAQNGSQNMDYNARFSDNNASKIHDEWPSTENPVASVSKSVPEELVVPFGSENKDHEAEKDEETVDNVGSHSISSRKFPDDSRGGFLNKNELYKNVGSPYLHQEEHDFERHEGGASVSSVTRNMEQLSVEKDERVLPSDEDDGLSLIIPDHLKVKSADLSHLSFGNFFSGTTIPSFSEAVTSLPGQTSLEERHTELDIPSVSHTDTREYEYYADDSFRNAAEGSLYRRTGSSDEPSSASQLKPEMNADEVQYSSYHPQLLNAALIQRNAEMQRNSYVKHQSYPSTTVPSTLLADNSSRESELEYCSRFNTTPEMAAKYGLPASSMSEALKTSGLSSMQPAPRNLSGLCGPTGGPSLPQHLAVHRYTQPSLPSGPYATMIGGYPHKPSAFQQKIANNCPYHQSLEAALPSRYRSSVSGSNASQFADIPSRYGYGGLRNEGTISGNFPMNPLNAAFSGRSLNYNDVLSSQYKDDSQLISLQQNEKSSMWPQGPSSRTMSAVPLDTYYNYQCQGQGQRPQPGGFKLSRKMLSNYDGPLGYPNYYHSQPGMAQDELEKPGQQYY